MSISRTIIPPVLRLTACVAIALLLGAGAYASDGAPYELEGTQVWSVPDSRASRDYSIFVSLPPSYEAQPNRRYAVLYITDAAYGFPLIRSIARRINSEAPVTEEFILVGLSPAKGDDPMVSRRRDYTPVARADGQGGGGPAYQAYLRDTVFPFVERKFRADPARRVFMGHSYGGLLGAQILLTEPKLFHSYILGSPSFWFADRAIFKLEAQYAKTGHDLPANVFLYVGAFEAVKAGDPRYTQPRDASGEPNADMMKDMAAFVARLRSHGYKSLHLQSEVIAGENHLTVFPTGFTRGIIQALPAHH